MAAKEKRLNMVLNRLNINVRSTYFLYGGIKRLSSTKRFFIVKAKNVFFESQKYKKITTAQRVIFEV